MSDPTPTFDSGHVIVPVKTVSGDLHNVAASPDVSLEDFHAALSADPQYLHELNSAQPTAAGALENSDDFRSQSKSAWDATSQGNSPNTESGFSVYSDGGASSLHTETHAQGTGLASQWKDKISYGPSDFGIVHTHPRVSSDKPSQNDIEAAKKIGKPIYVTSRSGLFMVRPSDGKVIQVFDNSDWMTKTPHEPKRK
jgi:hypothetical protein